MEKSSKKTSDFPTGKNYRSLFTDEVWIAEGDISIEIIKGTFLKRVNRKAGPGRFAREGESDGRESRCPDPGSVATLLEPLAQVRRGLLRPVTCEMFCKLEGAKALL